MFTRFCRLPRTARCLSRFLVVSVAALAVPALRASPPQQSSAIEGLRAALARLEDADTAAALGLLRRLTAREPEFAAGWGVLGEVLAARATGVATDFKDRLEADGALRRALRLDPDNPRFLAALGLLMRKQQIYLDARRVLDRALESAERNPDRLAPRERAELWFQRALFDEDQYLDTRNLVFAPQLSTSTPCIEAPTFCLNFTDPLAFNQAFRHAADLSRFGEDDYERMAEGFRRALAIDPTHDRAFRRLAVHLLDRREFSEVLRLAHSFIDVSPDSPWGHIVLGLYYQWTGRDSLAAVRFERGLRLAPPDVVRHYRDVSAIMRRGPAREYEALHEPSRSALEEALWRRLDPLYLTDENEARTTHLARVAFADLMFEDPSEGSWGSETERGEIYVRYGAPERVWQVHRDASRELAALDIAELENPHGRVEPRLSPHGGGRWIFWNYGWDLPNFIFQKQLRYRRATHQLSSFSKVFEEEARHRQPALFAPGFTVIDYPLQYARFRGSEDGLVELEVYSQMPLLWLGSTARSDSLDAGIFLFAEADYQPVFERTLKVSRTIGSERLTYSIPLAEGRYMLSVEAHAPGGAAAVRRGEVELRRFPTDSLALSDLVLANTVKPKVAGPAGRRDFAIAANPWLELDSDDPLAIYWEVYGLAPAEDGLLHYRVTLSVRDATGRGVVGSALDALGRLLGMSTAQDIRLTFERTARVTADRVPEYLSLDLDFSRPGEHTIGIEVIDPRTGRSALAERTFRVRRP